MQYETLVNDEAEMYNDRDQDYVHMPFELRVVEAALDVVSTIISLTPLSPGLERCTLWALTTVKRMATAHLHAPWTQHAIEGLGDCSQGVAKIQGLVLCMRP